MKVPIWDGVYENFKEVPAIGPGFRGERWIRNSLEKIKKPDAGDASIKELNAGGKVLFLQRLKDVDARPLILEQEVADPDHDDFSRHVQPRSKQGARSLERGA